MQNVTGKKISVIGAARSGVAVAQLLTTKGAGVFISDHAVPDGLKSHIRRLTSLGVEVETGGHSERVYDCSLMVISPGVPSNAVVVLEAGRRGIEVVSELEVAFWYCRSHIIAVTGSNGKTTTTTLIGRMLGDAKKKHVVAGNIGTAFSSVVLELDETSVAVLEVSSFQLDFCKSFHPTISVVLNITPDHMDRYDNSMELYSASKARIFKNQAGNDVLVYNADDEWSKRVSNEARCPSLTFSTQRSLSEGAFLENGVVVTVVRGVRSEVIGKDEISIPGTHNLANAMAATLAGQLAGVGIPSIRATLRNFKGVEHRLEAVRQVKGVLFVNDSKATNVDSVWYALQSYPGPIVLILGGRDKGNDYAKLFDLVRRNVRAVVAVGESADKVEKAFRDKTHVVRVSAAGSEIPNIKSMESAVRSAWSLARPGDVVLLSPACASFDWFHNYEERGRVFKEIVNNLS